MRIFTETEFDIKRPESKIEQQKFKRQTPTARIAKYFWVIKGQLIFHFDKKTNISS